MKFKKTSILSLSLSLLLVFGVTAAFASDPVEQPEDQHVPVLETPSPAENQEGGIYYKDGDGKLIPVDPNSISTAVSVMVNDDGTVTVDDGITSKELPEGSSFWLEGKNGTPFPSSEENYTPVDPADVNLSMMEEHLAQQVADGELTQAEADQMLAEIQKMLDKAKDGDVTLWISVDGNGNANSYCISSAGSEEVPAA